MSVRTTARIAASLVTAALLCVVAAPLAGAQQDPYGSTTTTTTAVGEAEASCSLSVAQGRPGTEVTATVAGVFFGEHVNVLFDGVIVGSATAPAAPVSGQSVSGAVVFGGQAIAAQAVDTTSVVIKFTVPKAAAGTHLVTAVGDTFTCFCNPRGEFKVLAVAGGGGGLARTGVEAGLVLVIAIALLLIGRTLVDGAKHRRRRTRVDDDERDLTSAGR